MASRKWWGILTGVLLGLWTASAEAQYWSGSPPQQQPQVPAAQPDQPVVPRDPVLQQRTPSATYGPQPAGPYGPPAAGGPVYGPPPPPAARTVPPPFTLTPYEEAQLDRVLQAWQQQSASVRSFACDFTRWEYDPVFAGQNPQQPRRIVQGKIMYAAPDKGLFRVDLEAVNGRMEKTAHPERWICDGKSIFEYKFDLKQVVEIPLPPELRGKAIQDGPLPFLFGAEAQKLKQRYYLRIVTPPTVKDEIWLQSQPRYQQDAANFQKAELILKMQNMQPFGLQTVEPNGQSRTIYQFDNVKINAPDLFRFLNDPFHPALPDNTWTKIVEGPPAAQAARPAAGSRR